MVTVNSERYFLNHVISFGPQNELGLYAAKIDFTQLSRCSTISATAFESPAIIATKITIMIDTTITL